MNSTRASDDASIAERVALAGRILALHGYEDLTLGHVSCRDQRGRYVYIKRKGPALSELTAEDIVRIDLEDDDALALPELHLEAVLHTEVYRARPDVGAVVHAHPWYATALAGTSAPLQMVTHDAALFETGLPVFDELSGMITEVAQGKAVARSLGDARAVLLRNHGVVVTGADLPWVVLTAVTLERAARMQFFAQSLGPLAPIAPAELPELAAVKYQDRFLAEYWDYWCRQVELAEKAGRLPPR